MSRHNAQQTTKPSPADIALGYGLGTAVPMAAFGKAVMAPFLILALVLAAWRFWAHRSKRQDQDDWLKWLYQPAVWVFAFWLISSLQSLDPVKSLETWVRTAGLVGVGVLFAAALDLRGQARLSLTRSIVATTLFSSVLVSVLLLLQSAGMIDATVLVFETPLDPAQRFKSFGAVAVCLIPLCLWFGWQLGGRWKVAALLCVPAVAVVLAGAGRQPSLDGLLGGIGGLTLLVIVAGLIHLPKVARRLLGIFCVAGATVLFFWICLNLPSVPVNADQTGALPLLDWHRQVIWGFAVDAFTQNWLFGVGPNAIDLMPGARDIIPGMHQEYIPGHPHNWLFEVMAETGVLGTAAIGIALLFLVAEFARRAANGVSGAWAAIFLCGAFWTSALANFSIWAAWWQACFIVLISIAFVLTRTDGTSR